MAFIRATDDVDSAKHVIREHVAKTLIEKNLLIPDAVFHLDLAEFIPNFIGFEKATELLCNHPTWINSKRVFITPDRSTELLRQRAIEQNKEVVMTTHGIRRGALLLTRDMVPAGQEEFSATLDGFERFGKPLTTLDAVRAAGNIDFMITGALFVSSAHGGRGGKGCGWFDSEWIMWQKMGLTSVKTPVAVIVHDTQVTPEAFPLQPWDVKADLIVTQAKIQELHVQEQPTEILWDKMDPNWRRNIPLMEEMYQVSMGAAH